MPDGGWKHIKVEYFQAYVESILVLKIKVHFTL
jgi:hypothetical protein